MSKIKDLLKELSFIKEPSKKELKFFISVKTSSNIDFLNCYYKFF